MIFWKYETTISYINVHSKKNYIRNIALNIGSDIKYEDFGAISRIDKNIESGYYPVKWTSESYTLQSYKKLGNDVIKAGELLCDAVYLNPLANLNQWYTPYED